MVNAFISDTDTCSIFMPTSLKPRCSKRWIICPMRRRWTPSGFTAIRVRSLACGRPDGSDRTAADPPPGTENIDKLNTNSDKYWLTWRHIIAGTQTSVPTQTPPTLCAQTHHTLCVFWCCYSWNSTHEQINDCMRSIKHTRGHERNSVYWHLTLKLWASVQ